MISEAEWIWRDGDVIPWRDANVHLLSLAVQFGSSVFEGVRCYATPDGPAIFRWPEHLRRQWLKGDRHRFQPLLPAALGGAPQQVLMAKVNAIEGADRHDPGHGRQVAQLLQRV